jgi:hypothetical protein
LRFSRSSRRGLLLFPLPHALQLAHQPCRPARKCRGHPGLHHGSRQRPPPRHHRPEAWRAGSPRAQHGRAQLTSRPVRTRIRNGSPAPQRSPSGRSDRSAPSASALQGRARRNEEGDAGRTLQLRLSNAGPRDRSSKDQPKKTRSRPAQTAGRRQAGRRNSGKESPRKDGPAGRAGEGVRRSHECLRGQECPRVAAGCRASDVEAGNTAGAGQFNVCEIRFEFQPRKKLPAPRSKRSSPRKFCGPWAGWAAEHRKRRAALESRSE